MSMFTYDIEELKAQGFVPADDYPLPAEGIEVRMTCRRGSDGQLWVRELLPGETE